MMMLLKLLLPMILILKKCDTKYTKMRKKYDSGILFSKKLILCIMLSPYKYQSLIYQSPIASSVDA